MPHHVYNKDAGDKDVHGIESGENPPLGDIPFQGYY